MPRALGDYDAEDWRHLRPLLHAYGRLRLRLIAASYAAKPPRAGDLAALRRAIAGGRAMVTIGFNDPEILDRQIRAIRAFVTGATHVIADNSRDDGRAAEIAALCTRLGAPYLRLPPNPWGPRSPSRSHGLAMNWVWRRLIRPARPEAFGFLDQDLAPLAPDDPFASLATQPVAGDKRWANGRWFLWAGYCFFRTAFLDAVRVDFGQDWPLGLDTGGGNWARIYSRLDPASIAERPIEPVAVFEDRPVADCYYERRGAWLHEVGFEGLPKLKAEKRARVLAVIDKALAEIQA